jgi:NAD(P) transhydrogenase subunit alpha
MVIGVPTEIMDGERRVAATPDTVKRMVQDGHQVLVQSGAGLGSFQSDELYEEAGATIMDDVEALFAKADVILKVKEPLFNETLGKHEADLMREGQILITFIHPASPANHELVRTLAKNGVTAITLDGIPRITRAQSMDALTSMSTCAGYKGMLMAASSLPKFVPMIVTAVGMIQPIKTLVIGAGVAGLQALATAKRLGAICHAADIRPDAVEQAASLGAKTLDLGVPVEEAVGEGGYAKKLSKERILQEREMIAGILPEIDVLFLSALIPGKQAPILITEEMVKLMKPGSVIIDISIDQGGNCAITPPGSADLKHGVTIVGIKNIPGLIPTSSTWMFAQNIYNLLKVVVPTVDTVDVSDEIVQSALTTYKGEIVHQGTLEAMNAEG